MAIVDRAFDPEVTLSTFGKRWGGELFMLSPAHLEALKAGETLALDVMGEYINFIALEKPSNPASTASGSYAAVCEPWVLLDWPNQVNRGE